MTEYPEIPIGVYCYTIESVYPDGRIKIKPCPYHEIDTTLPEMQCGICTKFNINDNRDGTLLWDMVKECGINDVLDESDVL